MSAVIRLVPPRGPETVEASPRAAAALQRWQAAARALAEARTSVVYLDEYSSATEQLLGLLVNAEISSRDQHG